MAMDLSGFVQRKTEITIGSKVFMFTELTLGDLATFKAELIKQREKGKDKRRERLMADAEKIGGIEPMELLKFLEKPLTEEEIDAEMETEDGMGFLAYLSLRYHHTEISKEQALGIITPSNGKAINEAMFPNDSKEVKKKPKLTRSPLKK